MKKSLDKRTRDELISGKAKGAGSPRAPSSSVEAVDLFEAEDDAPKVYRQGKKIEAFARDPRMLMTRMTQTAVSLLLGGCFVNREW